MITTIKHLRLLVLALLASIVSCTPVSQNVTTLSASPTIRVESISTIAPIENASSPFEEELAKDTWIYLSSDWATDNHLPWSWRSATMSGGDYANTAEIGLFAVSWLAAFEMKKSWSPSWVQTEAEVTAILDQLRAWQTGTQSYKPHGPNAYQNQVFYQWYWINWNPPVVGDANGTNHVVPSIDNAWLAVSLITIREYSEANNHPSMTQKADDILKDMNFLLWYHPITHRFSWGVVENPQGGSEADYYSNENRIINFVARAMGQLNPTEYRASLNALVQNPATYDSFTVEKVAWDGSYFTYTAPALFIHETTTAYGEKSITPATEAQIAYAQNNNYSVWGLSDCYDIQQGSYIQQGALPTANSSFPESHSGVISPHASALALITPLRGQAVSNLQSIANLFPSSYETMYGFRDSIMAKTGDPSYGIPSERFSALNQEWIFLSLANAHNGFIWKYFYRDEGVQQAHLEAYGQRVFLPFVLRQVP